MGDLKAKIASYKSKEFRLEVYEGRAHLQFPNTWKPSSKTTIAEIGDDYVEFVTTYSNSTGSKKTIVPINMVYIEDAGEK